MKDMRIGSEAVRKMKAQRLYRKFESFRFMDGESVDDFVVRLQNLVAGLGTVGEAIELNKVVEKLLRVVPKRLSKVAIAIEATTNLSKLTPEDAGGRLRAAEERKAEDDGLPPVRADGKLYLTEKEWDALRREHREKEHALGVDGCDKKGGRRGGCEDNNNDDDDG